MATNVSSAPMKTADVSLELLRALGHELRWKAVRALARSDYHVQELVALLGQPYSLVSYHLKKLRDLHIVKERRSNLDGRDIYYSLDITRLSKLYFAAGNTIHPAVGEDLPADETRHDSSGEKGMGRTGVLFLCTHNSARSQMAEGILRHIGGDRVEVESAGTEVTRVHPEAIAAMDSLGIDIREQRSKHLSEFYGRKWDFVITVCDRAKESCPIFPGDPERIHWSFDDPSAVEPESAKREAFRQTALELSTRIRVLLSLIEHRQNNAGEGARYR